MSEDQDAPEPEIALAVAALADAPAANAWGRHGRAAIQSSHTLSAPLAHVAAEWLERDLRQTPGSAGENQPEIVIPESVVQARPAQRLPEDAVCRSPIAGLVVSVLAAAGDTVKRHQAVLIVEAMKMLNNVGPEVDGVVKAIHVAPGDAVKAGQPVFELQLGL